MTFKNHKYILALCLVLIILMSISCKKFLLEPLDNRVSLENIEDIEKSIIGIQPVAAHIFTDFLTDDFEHREIPAVMNRDVLNKINPIFTFQIMKQSFESTQFMSSGLSPNDAYIRYYFRVNNCNLILDRLQKINTKDQQKVNNIKAQVLSIRAYCYYMLTTMFAKEYNSNTANSDIAVPYIGEYVDKALFHTKPISVEEIYTHIENDFINALTLINGSRAQNDSKFYWSKVAIWGMLSKVYLSKKDYQNVIKYADLVFAENSSVLEIPGIIKSVGNDASEFGKVFFDPKQSSYLMMSHNSYNSVGVNFTGYYIFPFISFLKTMGQANSMVSMPTSPIYNDQMPVKLYYNYTKGHVINAPIITVDEVMYNHAEAVIQSQNKLNASATSNINKLIDNSFFDETTRNTLKQELSTRVKDASSGVKFILNMKRARFFCEGVRWFDIKRHQLPVTHTYSGKIFNIDGTNPEEYVIKTPLEELQYNNLIGN